MPDKLSNVKIYDRPERKGPSPLLLVVGLIVVFLIAFALYKGFYHPAEPVTTTPVVKPVSYTYSSDKRLL